MYRDALKAKEEAEKLFQKLQESPYFLPGFEQRKRFILRNLIAARSDHVAFAQKPGRRLFEVTGYLVECCARLSRNIPRNTHRAEEFSRTIISHLQNGKRYNPDFLWLSTRGTRIMITGIGEIKSHINAIKHKPLQAAWQERNIRTLVELKRIPKILSAPYRVVLDKDFACSFILPRNADINQPYELPLCVPYNWKIIELEFSIHEILFMMNQILCPQQDAEEEKDRRSATPFAALSTYAVVRRDTTYRSFMKIIIQISEDALLRLFEMYPIIHEENVCALLTCWIIFFGNIPTSLESLKQIVHWSKGALHNGPSLLIKQPITRLTQALLTQPEQRSYSALARRFTDAPPSLLLAVLSRIREIKERLPAPPKIRNKRDTDLFSLI